MTLKPANENKVWQTYDEMRTAFWVAARINSERVDLNLCVNYFTASASLVGALAEIVTDLQARVAALEAR